MEHSEQPWNEMLAALARGEAVGFPTETVWGLGADAASRPAVESLAALKGRPAGKALQLSCASVEQARRLAAPGQPLFEPLCALLPGPVTLVVRASAACPAWLVYGGRVGLRVPDHPLVQELLSRWGGPLATTSLNPAGAPSALNLAQADAYNLASVLLSGEAGAGLPSTVIDGGTGQILRPGALSAERLQAALNGAR
ncbi:L-threonylcarbamoyladenylate synthase [Deinococcus sp.]|uniref:L-threonylcarbamoyladenylate synthase n=1 Tax=Deinococcus sp. TaxID=47478 RepID=UPI0025CFB303|nr:L-threonylcarbamoyladenylate synthase [Deinococcus sp.]